MSWPLMDECGSHVFVVLPRRRKTDSEARGWVRSCRCEPGTLPQAVDRWMVSAGGVWESQALEVLLMPSEPARDDHFDLCREVHEGLSPESTLVTVQSPLVGQGIFQYIVDNSVLRSFGKGLRHCLSRSLDDFHQSAISPWGSLVAGREMGDGWLQTTASTFLPMVIGGVPVLILKVESDFIVDNSELQTSTKGMRHRRTRRLDDLHPHGHSFWGSIVKGVNLGDGWVRLSSTGLFLPTHLKGVPVVVSNTPQLFKLPRDVAVEDCKEREYVLDNSKLRAATKGMRHRKGKSLQDFHERAHTAWGDKLIGVRDGLVLAHAHQRHSGGVSFRITGAVEEGSRTGRGLLHSRDRVRGD